MSLFFSAQQEERAAIQERPEVQEGAGGLAGGDIGEEIRLFILQFIILKENNNTKHNVGLYSCKD